MKKFLAIVLILGLVSLGMSAAQDAERAAIISAIHAALEANTSILALFIYDTQVENIQFSADKQWARADLHFYDKITGELIPTEPALALLLATNTGWQVDLQPNSTWNSTLAAVPSDLMPKSERSFWENALIRPQLDTVSGFLLPWAGGTSHTLSRSLSHEAASEAYAYDFAGRFLIRAAKAGEVWFADWSYPDGYYDGNCSHANYIVMRDTSTTPYTYHLYLHLAQDSIPLALRTRGAPVFQGQLLGESDDTGCSTGSHLHFQVHTVSTSWYGNSVDVTFNDVAINGGRPRTNTEAGVYGGRGQTSYLSGNLGSFVPAQPSITSPSANAIFSVGNLAITWEQGTLNYTMQADYALQIASNNSFSAETLVYDLATITANSQTVSMDTAGTYYLRMSQGDTISLHSDWTEPVPFVITNVPEANQQLVNNYDFDEAFDASFPNWQLRGNIDVLLRADLSRVLLLMPENGDPDLALYQDLGYAVVAGGYYEALFKVRNVYAQPIRIALQFENATMPAERVLCLFAVPANSGWVNYRMHALMAADWANLRFALSPQSPSYRFDIDAVEVYRRSELVVGESGLVCLSPATADTNLDGIVSPTDALYVINRLGSADLSADVNHDGLVTEADVQAVIAKFGTTP